MVALFNSFFSYLVVAICFLIVIVAGVLTGKTLREKKDAKNSAEVNDTNNDK